MKQSSFFLCMIIASIAAMSFTSCSNSSASESVTESIRAKVKERYFGEYTLTYNLMDNVKIFDVDPMFKVGDIIEVEGTQYQIIEIEDSCPFESGECNQPGCKNYKFFEHGNNAYDLVDARAYQLELYDDSIAIYDGKRYVGAIPSNWDNPETLERLIIADNE